MRFAHDTPPMDKKTVQKQLKKLKADSKAVLANEKTPGAKALVKSMFVFLDILVALLPEDGTRKR